MDQSSTGLAVLSLSMRISLPFPYARKSIASWSSWVGVKPGSLLIAFNNCFEEGLPSIIVTHKVEGRVEAVTSKGSDIQCW